MVRTNKDRTRVIHLLSSAEVAGGERCLYNLVNYSHKLILHHIILPYKGPFAKVLNDSGLPFNIILLKHKYFFRSVLKIIKLIRSNNIDIVHTHGYRASFYGRIACLLTNTKHMATVHVSLFDYKNTPNILRYFYYFIEMVLSFKTFKFICISKAMANDMRRLKIPLNKIIIIPNGVDLKRFYPRSNNIKIRNEFNVDFQTILIGTAGRMVPEKGHIFLIKALKQLKNKNRNLKCIFLGSGPLFTKTKNNAALHGVEDMCIFAGTRKDIEEIYPVLNLFVLPSVREPFGLVLLEAMATQIPVIATASGGPLEFIKTGVNGMLVPPKDASALASVIKQIIQNENYAKKIAAGGRATVEQYFDIKKTVAKLDRLYFSK